jgi:DNA repair ATPase RecN
MSANYELYLAYLASFADSHNLADIAENNIYPLFSDIKRLINHYRNTLEKFENVQGELVRFVDRIEFDENDFDYYQTKFQELREVDSYLQELKSKQVAQQTASEIQNFISDKYKSTSLYTDIKIVEEQVLAKINYTYDIKRSSGCLSVILLFIISLAILGFTIHKL